jgi:Asp-tRNA(Asn)/Glu-tRNA(Gln) amidotransferase A subunit family amidase
MPGELLSGPLIEIAQALREKRVSAQELIEAAIARHEHFGERLGAYSLWAPEQARAVAKAADAAFSADPGPSPHRSQRRSCAVRGPAMVGLRLNG